VGESAPPQSLAVAQRPAGIFHPLIVFATHVADIRYPFRRRISCAFQMFVVLVVARCPFREAPVADASAPSVKPALRGSQKVPSSHPPRLSSVVHYGQLSARAPETSSSITRRDEALKTPSPGFGYPGLAGLMVSRRRSETASAWLRGGEPCQRDPGRLQRALDFLPAACNAPQAQ